MQRDLPPDFVVVRENYLDGRLGFISESLSGNIPVVGAKGGLARVRLGRSVVQRKQLPDEIPELAVDLAGEPDLGLLDLMGARHLGFAKSNSEGRRLVAQGGVRVEGEPVSDPTLRLGPGSYLVQVGKRRFGRVTLA